MRLGGESLAQAARLGRAEPGPNPTGRARPGFKHQISTDANGTPIAAILTDMAGYAWRSPARHSITGCIISC
ncbi:Transposase [Mycetohabitans rhizoxinica HKI 454]|uniref:Transposase n=1 Tax=Mycetohabitans rhizoxinica (strain DSM 19002 / CIP 109453 / HKI 454) TaxID=882378 RepID=E5ARP3_MYCRK|nr:Transposase [Mycetohabitans rhizoxinica HKI 454]